MLTGLLAKKQTIKQFQYGLSAYIYVCENLTGHQNTLGPKCIVEYIQISLRQRHPSDIKKACHLQERTVRNVTQAIHAHLHPCSYARTHTQSTDALNRRGSGLFNILLGRYVHKIEGTTTILPTLHELEAQRKVCMKRGRVMRVVSFYIICNLSYLLNHGDNTIHIYTPPWL